MGAKIIANDNVPCIRTRCHVTHYGNIIVDRLKMNCLTIIDIHICFKKKKRYIYSSIFSSCSLKRKDASFLLFSEGQLINTAVHVICYACQIAVCELLQLHPPLLRCRTCFKKYDLLILLV